jgi:hypothetical protein
MDQEYSWPSRIFQEEERQTGCCLYANFFFWSVNFGDAAKYRRPVIIHSFAFVNTTEEQDLTTQCFWNEAEHFPPIKRNPNTSAFLMFFSFRIYFIQRFCISWIHLWRFYETLLLLGKVFTQCWARLTDFHKRHLIQPGKAGAGL